MRLDLHVHTGRSDDSLMTPAEIIRTTLRRGLDGLAITDHNTIEGALALQEAAPFQVIVGEEIKTTEGEITGLFLRATIPPGLSPEETIAAIREQGGLVYVPHPLDRLRHSAVGRRTLARIIDRVDVLEVFNARMLFPRYNREARRVAEAHGLAMGAGSDAHLPIEIGRGYVAVEPFDGPASFLAALHRGCATGTLTTPLIHVTTTLTRQWHRLARG
jgi:predicted metal-dependent phosphoesterase TrpH